MTVLLQECEKKAKKKMWASAPAAASEPEEATMEVETTVEAVLKPEKAEENVKVEPIRRRARAKGPEGISKVILKRKKSSSNNMYYYAASSAAAIVALSAAIGYHIYA